MSAPGIQSIPNFRGINEVIQGCLLELVHSITPDQTLSDFIESLSDLIEIDSCAIIEYNLAMSSTSLLAANRQFHANPIKIEFGQFKLIEKSKKKQAIYSISDHPKILVIPFISSNILIGGLCVKPGASESDEVIESLLHISPILATIVNNVILAKTQRRHDLYEERAAISRELHDSLAQSLTYLKIQVARLESSMNETTSIDNQNKSQSKEILIGLRESLNSAYRQLRELMTTFRLTMHGKSFQLAVKDSIDEFSSSNIAFHLNDTCPSNILSVDEEMQVLQIIREALYNIVRHSRATQASISLKYRQGKLIVNIDDNGVGIDIENKRQRHHGVIIMQERALNLGGELEVNGRPKNGTQIIFSFQPKIVQ